MKKLLLSFMAMATFSVVYCQNTFKATILDADSNEPLIGVNVLFEEPNKGGVTDLDGTVAIENLPNGNYEVRVSYVSYETIELEVSLPQQEPLTILLESGSEELETVTVTTTRSSRLIQDLPTRLEAITAEELGEKAFMNSTNISMLLRESTGIQMQQTSANSANQSIRIQGLDGRYTQLLKDGFPIFGGFAGGLSIMQIPPLDLKQVEIIKGSASTLYGGGAIAGLVNLISKRPEEEPQLEFMFTQTQALGSTLNGFYAEEYGKAGFSLYAVGNLQQVYDVNDDDFSELPEVKNIAINPTFFYNFDETSSLRIGINSSFENRLGGDVTAIENSPSAEHPFTEENKSTRLASQISYQKAFSEDANLTIRNSVNFFDRSIGIPDFTFDGQQIASFSEVSYSTANEKADWVFGANMWTEEFTETPFNQNPVRDYSNNTFGVFGQNVWSFSEKAALESGLRIDYNTDYDWFVLPRINLLLDLNEHWTTRIGGGMGYKLPTIFSEEAESRTFQSILPIGINDTKAEKSAGINLDVNYKTILFDEVSFSINNLFFYTQLFDPLILTQDANNQFLFVNADGKTDSKGLETNIKFSYDDFKLYLQYAFIDAQLDYDGINRQKPITPKHNAGGILMYESGKWRLGYEVYFTGGQTLFDLSPVEDYWTMGLLVSRQIEKLNVFVNFENFTDTRLSKFQDTVIPPHTNPSFPEIWAPTDGFIFTAGLKWTIFGEIEEE
ncbi:TonB-dependent receptor [Lewinella cohaerens]|jgi:iron complex outermembrane receptor protein|uniref:TonB-dependent receptor n=1 Tax=Lewinella cohaerens TaxID=70995 RepID=UPI0004762418|nr:TonB-dependent receptor [Lewinella cohaerens]